MTLETAKRIVAEQGESASKEAQAVVRGGMTVCELTNDGHRTYPWIKVFPSETDTESSIEQAIKMRRAKKMSSSMNKKTQPEPVVTPAKASEIAPVQVLNEDESPDEQNTFSIYSLISKGKQKLLELWKEIDEIVVE